MIAYSLNLGIFLLATSVLAEGPGGYMSPWSKGGSMTTFPAGPQKETKGTPFNLIVSNKSDIVNDYEWDFTDFLFSLGYEHDFDYGKRLPGSMQANVGGSNITISDTIFQWYSPDCKDPKLACLQISYWIQHMGSKYGPRFITAAIANSSSEGIQVIENGYDLARDQIVSRATLNYTSELLRNNNNRTQAFKSTVVFNDTELLANVSASDLRSNVGTDRRVPILLVERHTVSENDTLKEFPLSTPSIHGSGATSIANHFLCAKVGFSLLNLVALFIL